MKKEILVSKKNVNKAVKYINSLNDKEYFELEKKFRKEQPNIFLYIGIFIEENKMNGDIVDDIVVFMLIIWLSFKNECEEIPIVTEEIIDLIDEESFKNDIEMGKYFGIDINDPEYDSKLEKLNKKFDLRNFSNPDDFLSMLEKEGLGDFIPELFKNVSNLPQENIDSYIASEVVDLEDDYNLSDIANLQSVLRVIIKLFDTIVNQRPIMQVIKSTRDATISNRSNQKETNVYQVKISLDGIKPPIWRRFLVEDDITLDEFHETILDIMGWVGAHLYSFDIDGFRYESNYDEEFFQGDYDSEETLLRDVIKREKQKFKYTYDFGDNWQHTILIEKILPFDNEQDYPFCIKGKRNCPPEDCGGIWGYQNLLKAISDKNHPEREELLDWLGDEYDPEEFDIDQINSFL
ncbi:MAG: plasmid pRiA4b ORF-3 family protein [Bacteroidales bacterium]|nr:plasmid pRiA4b ORF-3 family protein [Bacteroidales bacterium]